MIYVDRSVIREEQPSGEGSALAEKEAENGNSIRKRKRHNSTGNKPDNSSE